MPTWRCLSPPMEVYTLSTVYDPSSKLQCIRVVVPTGGAEMLRHFFLLELHLACLLHYQGLRPDGCYWYTSMPEAPQLAPLNVEKRRRLLIFKLSSDLGGYVVKCQLLANTTPEESTCSCCLRENIALDLKVLMSYVLLGLGLITVATI